MSSSGTLVSGLLLASAALALVQPPAAGGGGAVLARSVTIEAGQAPVPAPQLRGPTVHELARGERAPFVVRSPHPADVLRRGLEALGLRPLIYLPEGAWLVELDRASGARLEGQIGALGIDVFEPWHPAWKLAPELGEGSGQLNAVVHLFDGRDAARVRARLEALGAEVVGEGGSIRPRIAFRAGEGKGEEVSRAVAKLPEVFWIEARGEVRLLNDKAVPLLQSGRSDGPEPIHAAGLLGQGQIVGYIDTGLDVDSCFVVDEGVEVATNTGAGIATSPSHRKIHAYDFLWSVDSPADATDWDNHGHGTHVAGNIGGACEEGSQAAYNGMAPEVRFVVQDGGYQVNDCADLPALGCPVIDLHGPFAQARAQGAHIHTNSWGDNENSPTQYTYSAGSEDADDFMWRNKDFLLIFAAGNSGPGARTVGSPSTAKNVLAVGGSGSGSTADRVVSFSSRGPTADGRIKPDLMAPASNTSAATDGDVETFNCDLDTGAGTSYAAPLVAGAAALVRQYFAEGYYPSKAPRAADGFEPSAALLKAMLISSGRNMSQAPSPIPSMDQGFGRVTLGDTLALPGDAEELRVVDGTRSFSASGEAPFVVEVDVVSSSVPLKVSLVWTDPPSTPAASRNLVNDLDLTVSGARRTYLGNQLTGGQSSTGGSADRLNTVEVVLIPSPRAGRWTVSVSPWQIPSGPQDFALVIRGDLAP